MKTTKMTYLERKCYGLNKINQLTKEQIKHVLPQLEQYIGKKVKLATGDKAKSFKVELLDVPYNKEEGASYRKYLKFEYMRLNLFNDVTVADQQYESGGYGVSYYKKEPYLGVVNEDGILTSVYTFDEIVKNSGLDLVYDADEVQAKQKQIEALEEQLRALKYQIPS